MPSTPPIKVPILGVDLYSKEFKKMTKRAKATGRSVEGAGRKLSMLVTAPILAAGGASVKFAKDLNASMANVGTLIPGQTKRLVEMKKSVQDLSVETGVAAKTISEGLYDTISAFGDAGDPIKKLTIATRMSKAGLSTVQEAIGLVSAVTKGYGDTSDAAAQKASDLAFQTVKLGQTTFPDLAASIGRVVPMAATLKVSQEELFGAMATLTGVTGNAAEVSTQLRSVLGAMIKPSADMTKAAKRLGYDSAVAMVKEEGLAKSLDLLGKATGGSTEKLGKLLTRKEGLTAALALLGKQSGDFTEKTKEMGEAAGATELAYKSMTTGLYEDGHKLDQAKRRVEEASTALGDKLLPVIVKLTNNLAPMIDSIASADAETLEWGIKLAAGAAVMGPLLIGVGKMIAIGPGVIGFFSKWKTVLAASRVTMGASTLATTQFNKKMILTGDTLRGVTSLNSDAARSSNKFRTALQKTTPTLKESFKQAGYLRSGLSVVAAGGAGWAVGTLIYDNLVKPFQDSLKVMGEVDAKMKDISKPGGTRIETTKNLDKTAADLRATIRTQEKLELGAGARGFHTESKKLKQWKSQLAGLDEQIGYRKKEDSLQKTGYEDITAKQSVMGMGAKQFDEALLIGAIEQSRQGITDKVALEITLPEGVNAKVKKPSGSKVDVSTKGAVMTGGI